MINKVTIPASRAPFTPGEILVEEFLLPFQLSQSSFARHVGWSPRKVSEICTGKRAVTPETAMVLEDVFGVSAQFWLNAQLACDLYKAKSKHKKAKMLPQVRKLLRSNKSAAS